MKIAYIALRGIPLSDGISKYTEGICPILAKKGHEIYVYTSKRYGNKTGYYNGFNIITVPSFKNKYLEKLSIVFFSSLHMMFRKYDIVHYHAFGPSIFAFLAKLSRKKVVIQSHGIEHQRAKWGKFAKKFLYVTEKSSIKMANEITVVSKTLHEYFLNKYDKNTIYIPTAVNIENSIEPKTITDKWNLIGRDYYFFMARLVPEKGIHTLIEGYKLSSTKKKLIISGPIDDKDSYYNYIYNLAKNDKRIIFTGMVDGDTKKELLSNAFVFCQPSELEGLSVSLLEAMSYGNCVFASDIPENLEVCSGLSFTFKNKDIVSCTETIEYIEQNIDLVNTYRFKSKKYIIDNHLLENIVDRIEEMYFDILK